MVPRFVEALLEFSQICHIGGRDVCLWVKCHLERVYGEGQKTNMNWFGVSQDQGTGVICGFKNRWDGTTIQNWVCHSEKKMCLWDKLCFESIRDYVWLCKKEGDVFKSVKRVGYTTLKNMDWRICDIKYQHVLQKAGCAILNLI